MPLVRAFAFVFAAMLGASAFAQEASTVTAGEAQRDGVQIGLPLTFDGSPAWSVYTLQRPPRLFVDISNSAPGNAGPIALPADSVVLSAELQAYSDSITTLTRLVVEFAEPTYYDVRPSPGGVVVVLEGRPGSTAVTTAPVAAGAGIDVVSDLQSRLASAEAALAAAQTERERLERQAADAAAAQGRLDALGAEIAARDARLAELQHQEATEDAALRGELAQARDAMAALQAERDALEGQLRDDGEARARAESDAARAASELASLRTQVDRASAEGGQDPEAREQAAAMARSLEAREAELRALQDALAAQNAAAHSAATERDAADRALADALERLAAAEDRERQRQAELDAAAERERQRQAELDAAAERQRQAERDAATGSGETDATEVEAALRRAREAERLALQQEAEIEALRRQLEQAEAARATSSAQPVGEAVVPTVVLAPATPSPVPPAHADETDGNEPTDGPPPRESRRDNRRGGDSSRTPTCRAVSATGAVRRIPCPN